MLPLTEIRYVMFKVVFFTWAPVILLFVQGCGENGSGKPTAPGGTDRSSVDVVSYQLGVGNEWRYEATDDWTFECRGLDGAIVECGVERARRLSTVDWRVMGREQVKGIGAARLEVIQTVLEGHGSGATFTADVWLSMKGDTLKVVDYTLSRVDVFASLWKPVSRRLSQELMWNSVVFPLRVGRRWEFASPSSVPDHYDIDAKEVVGVEQVDGPDGPLLAFRVVHTKDRVSSTGGDYHMRQSQWFAPIGIVRMEQEEFGTIEWTAERGNILGRMFNRRVSYMVLKSYHVQGPAPLEGAYVLRSYTAKFQASGQRIRLEPPSMTGSIILRGGRYTMMLTSVDIPDDEPDAGWYAITGDSITLTPDEIDLDDPDDGPTTFRYSLKGRELTLSRVDESYGVSLTVVYVRS